MYLPVGQIMQIAQVAYMSQGIPTQFKQMISISTLHGLPIPMPLHSTQTAPRAHQAKLQIHTLWILQQFRWRLSELWPRRATTLVVGASNL